MKHKSRKYRFAAVSGAAILSAAALQTPGMAAPGKMVTLSGTLSCLGCDMKKAHGAAAQCKVYGHKHALKTKNGKYYTFLENGQSAPLVKGEEKHNKQVRVYGAVLPRTQVIEVKNFRVIN